VTVFSYRVSEYFSLPQTYILKPQTAEGLASSLKPQTTEGLASNLKPLTSEGTGFRVREVELNND